MEYEKLAEEEDIDNLPESEVHGVVRWVDERYRMAKDARMYFESDWITAYNNYKSKYEQFLQTEKSQASVAITKVKVLAAFGQVSDVLFGSHRFPLTIDPTTLPEGVEENVSMDTQDTPEAPQQPTAQVTKLLPGETRMQLKERLGPLTERLQPVEGKLKAGPGTTPTAVTWQPAMIAAKNMEKKIHDQLEESRAIKELRRTAFELCLFGTGIFKGPFKDAKEYPRWTADGTYEPIKKVVPRVGFVSIWDFFPDPDATQIEDCEYVIERHKMSRRELRSLKKRPLFDKNAIDEAILYGEDYTREYYETNMDQGQTAHSPDRFEVLEFWGHIDQEIAVKYGLTIPERYADEESVQVNIWTVNNQVIRFAVNPFTPSTLRYYVCPYELDPYSIWGVGVGANMKDTQRLMNGFLRMAVDNAALSGNLIFEVNNDYVSPTEDLQMYPGKVIKTEGAAPGQTIFSHKFQNVSQENMQMFDMARRLADESTGLPSFAHGQTGVSGVGRTSSGISMLMSAANGSIRTVVKNIDDYLLSPLGQAMFQFNMQFDFDPKIQGDLEVNARGTESLMANEVRSQRLIQFLSTVLHPNLAPFAKLDKIIGEIAKSLDLDPDQYVNNLNDAALQAEILKKLNPQPEDPMAAMAGGMPAGPQAPGPNSGNGQIGNGAPPLPGGPGFSANTGEGME